MSDYNKYYLKFADRAEMETVYRQPHGRGRGYHLSGVLHGCGGPDRHHARRV